MNSTNVPIFGMPSKASVIRKIEGDDGFGGISLTDSTVYSNRTCRVTTMTDKEEREAYGEAGGKRWKIVMELSRSIRTSDFVRLSWGTFPNVETAGGLDGEFPPTVIVTTPAGSKTLTWFYADSKYSDADSDNDPANTYTVSWTGTVWRFTDTVAPITVDFTGYEKHHNVFNLDWSTLVGASYSVTSQTSYSIDYRVILVKHQHDPFGRQHHTSMTIELEDTDNEDE